ncbi:MAG: ATP-binding cassette domain-containing protein, partial [Myxococcota bacterium]
YPEQPLGRTILEEVRAANPEASETKVRALCGAVLFTGDDVDKKVEVLSGGEKARVALARMLATPANLLLLDEPTNHLDTESADVLTESLEGFDGTILFVSHNLDFARRLSTKVWDVSGGKIEAYPGDLGAYLEHLETRQAELRNTFAQQGMGGSPHQVAEAKPVSVTPGRAPGASSKAERIAAREARKKAETERKRRVRAVEEAVARAESAVAQLEREKEELEGKLEDASVLTDPEALRRTSEQLGEVSQALEGALETWAEAEAERESLGD